MKTNLNIEIKTEYDAVQFLNELCQNGEEYHPEDDAMDVQWNSCEDPPTAEEMAKLNELMAQVYANTDIDPCEIIVNHINTKS